MVQEDFRKEVLEELESWTDISKDAYESKVIVERLNLAKVKKLLQTSSLYDYDIDKWIHEIEDEFCFEDMVVLASLKSVQKLIELVKKA